jgi:sugar lactone lactonase YvrE
VITGTGFVNVQTVKFGGVDAKSFVVNSTTNITAIVGAGASGAVSVTTTTGTATRAGFVLVIPPPPAPMPTITNFSPTSATAGTVVRITGTGLFTTTAVRFGGTPANLFTVDSDSLIIATVGGGATGAVSVTTKNGTATRAGFVFWAVPVISALTTSQDASSTSVRIVGKYFTGVTAVLCNELPVRSFTVHSDTLITATSGANFTGIVRLVSHGTSVRQSVTASAPSSQRTVSAFSVGASRLNVSTFAGTGVAGYADGASASAQFNDPCGLAIDAAGNIYVADYKNYRIRKISPSGVVTSIGGAVYSLPWGVAVDAAGNIYVAHPYAHRISKVSPNGNLISTAGAGQGYVDGPALNAGFNYPSALAVNAAGTIFVADNYNHCIRAVSPNNLVTTFAGTGTVAGYADGTGTSAQFYNPTGLVIDAAGNLYVADQYNHRIRKITPAGVVTTIAGSGQAGYVDGAAATAQFDRPVHLALDGAGTIYVTEAYSNRIRKISGGTVSTFTGTGIAGYLDGPAETAQCDFPWGIAVASNGTVYFSDSHNQRIRRIGLSPTQPVLSSFTPSTATSGTTVVISGSGLIDASAVSFGSVAAQSFVVNSDTQITAVLGAGASGTVSVTSAGGTGTKTGFTFVPTPSITSFSPQSASTGTQVLIRGNGFTGSSAVSFGGVAALSFTVNADTLVTARVATGASGVVAISTPYGGASKAGFIFLPPPTITSFTPTSAPAGATVTVTGTGFTGTSTVKVGSVVIASFTVVSDTQVTFIAPPTGAGAVSITTPNGTAITPQWFTVQNPGINSIAPTSAFTGTANQTLTVSGARFGPNAVIYWDSTALATTVVSSTQVTALIPPTLLLREGTAAITVRNAPAGVASAAFTFTIVPSPNPTLTAITPDSFIAADADTTLVFTGANFQSGATVNLRSVFGFPDSSTTSLPTTFISTTELRATLPRSIAANTNIFSIFVRNPQAGSATTSTLGLVIQNPVPVLDSITPTTAIAPFTQPVTLTLFGTGFTSSSLVRLRDSTRTEFVALGAPFITTQTPTRLVLTVPDSLLRAITPPATLLVSVLNPRVGTYEVPASGGVDTSSSRPLRLTQPPVPTLAALSTTQATVGVANLTLNFTGTNFVNAGAIVTMAGNAANSFVRWTLLNAQGAVTGVVDIPATTISSTQLSLTIPSALTSTAAVVTVQVVTPGAPAPSAAQPFAVVNPVPTLTALTPSSVLAGTFTQDVTLNGTGFAPGARVLVNGQTIPSSVVNATQIRVTLTAAQMQRAALVGFRVVNDSILVGGVAMGGGTSQEQVLPVLNPAPTLTTAAPAYGLVGQAQTLTLTGANFALDAQVRWDGANGMTLPTTATTILSPTQITLTLSTTLTQTAGIHRLVVINPALQNGAQQAGNSLGGGASDTLSFAVLHPTPTLTTLTSTTATLPLTTSTVTLTLTGTGFSTGTQVLAQNPSLLPTAFTVTNITPTTITAQIPAALLQTTLQTATTFSVTVQNPSISAVVNGQPLPLNGGTSAAQTFALVNARPTLASISPTTTTATLAPMTLTVTGTNFVPTSLVRVAGVTTNVVTTYVSPTQLTASFARAAGSYAITVVSPSVPILGLPVGGGVTAVTKTLTITPADPTLTSLSATSTTASASAVGAAWTLTLTGTNFTTGSRVLYNGVALAGASVTVVSDTEIRALLPAVPITSATHTLAVQNGTAPNVFTSATLTLAVHYPQPALRVTNPLTPATTIATLDVSKQWTITIAGTNFAAVNLASPAQGLQVLINGQPAQAQNILSATATQIRVATNIAQAGVVSVAVVNPSPLGVGGGTSSTATLTVMFPDPTLTVIVPPNPALSASAGTETILTLAGTGFTSATTLRLTSPAPVTTTTLSINAVTVQNSTTLSVTIPADLIQRIGAYSLLVVNPPTNGLGGGTSNALTLTVRAAQATQADFVGVTTAITAGNALAAFTVRFKDQFGNLVANNVNVNFANEDGSSTGTITLIKTGTVGVSTATATRLYEAGTYRLWVAGITTTTGNVSVVVNPNVDARVELAGVPPSVLAGDTIPRFVVRYFDVSGNPTDNGIGAVRFTRTGVAATLATVSVPVTRLAQGVYQAQTLTLSTVAQYTVAIAGISTTNTIGNAVMQVQPGRAYWSQIVGVSPTLTAGQNQAAFTVTERDAFGQLTDIAPTSITYSNSTSATAEQGFLPFTGSITLTRTALGVFTATVTQVQAAGLFALAATGVSTTTGTMRFRVNPAAAQTAEIINTMTRFAVSDSLRGVVAILRDQFGNLSDRTSMLTFTRTSPAPTTTGTIAMRRELRGVSTATATLLPAEGTYQLSIAGLAAANITGATTLTVVSTQAAVRCDVVGLVPSVIAGDTVPPFSIYFQDQRGAFVDYNATLRYSNADGSVRGALALTRSEAGVSTATASVFTKVGTYTLWVEGIGTTTGTRTLVVQPDTLAKTVFEGLPARVGVGRVVPPFTVSFRDQYDNLVDATGTVEYEAMTMSSTGTFSATPVKTGVLRVTGARFGEASTYRVAVEGMETMDGGQMVEVDTLRPAITQIVPGEVEFASSTTITISGREFDSTSQALFKGVLLQTRFINDSLLQADIPVGLTTEAREDSVYVLNPLDATQSSGRPIKVKNGEIQTSGLPIPIDGTETHTVSFQGGIINKCTDGSEPTITLVFNDLIVRSCGSEISFPLGIEKDRASLTATFSTSQLAREMRCIGAGSRTVFIKIMCGQTLISNKSTFVNISNPIPVISNVRVLNVDNTVDLSDVPKPLVPNGADAGITRFTVNGSGFVYDSELQLTTQNCNPLLSTISPAGKTIASDGKTFTFSIFNSVLRELLPDDRTECSLSVRIRNSNTSSGIRDAVLAMRVVNTAPVLRTDRRITPNRYRLANDPQATVYTMTGRNLNNADLFFDYIQNNGQTERIKIDIQSCSCPSNQVEHTLYFRIDPSFSTPLGIFTVSPRAYRIVARDRTSGKESKDDVSFYIAPAPPIVNSVKAVDAAAPSQAAKGGRAAQVTIDGRWFTITTIVGVNGVAQTASQTSSQLVINVPETLVRTGTNTVSVTTPPMVLPKVDKNFITVYNQESVGGGTAAPQSFDTQGISPSGITLAPLKVIARLQDTTFIIRGTNLTHESRVVYARDANRRDTLVRGNTKGFDELAYLTQGQLLQLKLKGSVLEMGDDSMTVINPDGRGGYFASNTAGFRSYEPNDLPRIDTVSPYFIRPMQTSELTITGTNFAPGTLIELFIISKGGFEARFQDYKRAGAMQPTIISPTSLKVTIPADAVAKECTLLIRAVNADTVGFTDYRTLFNGKGTFGRVPVAYPPTIIGPLQTHLMKYASFVLFGSGEQPYDDNTLFIGKPDNSTNQEFFIIRGDYFDTEKGVIVLMDGRAIEAEMPSSDKELHFGITTPLTGVRGRTTKILSLTAGEHTFTLRNKTTGIYTETPWTQKIMARTPTIDVVRTMQGVIVPRGSIVHIPYQGSVQLKVESGGDDAPGAKNFATQSVALLNNRPDSLVRSQFNPSDYSLTITIPAAAVNEGSGLYDYASGTISVSTPQEFLASGERSLSKSYPITFVVDYPAPSVTRVVPARIPADATSDTSITIEGTNFVSRTRAFIQYSKDTLDAGIHLPYLVQDPLIISTTGNPSQRSIIIPRQWRSTPTTDTLLICNGQNCTTVHLPVVPLPRISSIRPDTLDASIQGEPVKADTVSIAGNYLLNTTALWNGAVPLTRLMPPSDTLMRVIVPEALHDSARVTALVVVSNQNDSATAQVVVAYPRPQIDRIEPDTLYVGPPATLFALSKASGQTASMGDDLPPVIAGERPFIPVSVALYPNAPNPFDERTTISYALPDESTVHLEVVDMFGRVVAELVPQKRQAAGVYRVEWNTARTPTGVYYAVLRITGAGGAVERRMVRMTLVR